jgi:hypothetical protein
MSDLARQQCFHHPGREAVVRCPSCLRDYCRECVTEHDERYLCSACLRLQTSRQAHAPGRRLPAGLLMALLGLVTAWTVFFAAAQYLALRSSADHVYRTRHVR